MSDTVISVENLGKKYRIRHQQVNGMRYKALRDVLADKSKAVARRLWSVVSHPNRKSQIANQKSAEDFWALKNVSFEVRRGEVLGIIGRNGAGKSTLLKILSRITEPTEGRVSIDGRVASLLEVGTGFHPELTGRENIFLNGAVLGMTKVEIKSRFDEIVAFAEVEKFLDTPVKRYSSGMYVRLAFSIAAHLQPEVLILDEVLAVGDAQFQKKCLGKMQAVAETFGRTVLFVSHNMGVIQTLCERCILLEFGKVAVDATPSRAIQSYLSDENEPFSFERNVGSRSQPSIESGKIESAEAFGQPAMRIAISVMSPDAQVVALDLRICDRTGAPVAYGSLGCLDTQKMLRLCTGRNAISFLFPINQLANGSFVVSLDLTVPFVRYLDRVERCLFFNVNRGPSPGSDRVMLQDWGVGSVELAVLCEEGTMSTANLVRNCYVPAIGS